MFHKLTASIRANWRSTGVIASTCLFASVIGLYYSQGRSPTLEGIAGGFITGFVTYFLVSWWPENTKRRRVRNNLTRQYDSFKEECISIFFSALKTGYSLEQLSTLKEQAEFIHYFREKISDSQERWHAVLNGLDADLVRRLVVQIEILVDEVRYSLTVIDIENDDVFEFLKRLSQITYRYRDLRHDYDDIKTLSGFMWSIHTGWSVIEGYTDRDIVAEMIAAI